MNQFFLARYLPVFTLLPFVKDHLYSQFIWSKAANPVQTFRYAFAGVQILNPTNCGSEVAVIQRVKLMSGWRFSPLVPGRCYHWICVEESVACLWSPVGKLWLLAFVSMWSKGGDSLLARILARERFDFCCHHYSISGVAELLPRHPGTRWFFQRMTEARRSAAPPSCAIVCDFVSALLQRSRWQEKSVSLGIQQRKSNFSLVLPVNIAVNQVSFKGEQQGQRGSLAENTWQLLRIPISRCGGFSSTSFTCLV